MSNFRPAGMSDEDSDDEGMVFCASSSTSFNIQLSQDKKTETAPAPLPGPPTGGQRGGTSGARGRDVDIPWQTVQNEDDWDWNGRSKAGTSSSSAGQPQAAPPLSKTELLDSIPYLDKVKAGSLFTGLKAAWQAREYDRFTKICRDAYSEAENPYSLALYFMVKSPDFFLAQANRSMSCSVISGLKSYLKEAHLQAAYLDQALQEVAFSLIIKQKKATLIKEVIDVFQIARIREELIESIRNLSERKQYKEACSAATALGVLSFDIHDFLIPLVLQDRVGLVEGYIENSVELQRRLLSYLDGLLLNRRDLSNKLQSYIYDSKMDLNEVKQDKLNEGAITKLVKRLADKYKVDASFIPNVKTRQKLNEVRHLVHRRYDKKFNLDEENFHELLKEMIENDQTLIEEVLFLMRNYNDYASAAKLVKRFNIPVEIIPQDIREFLGETISKPSNKAVVEEDWETDTPSSAKVISSPSAATLDTKTTEAQPWMEQEDTWATASVPQETGKAEYKVPLTPNSIFTVSSLNDVVKFCDYIQREIEKNGTVVTGIDAEWKPIMAKLGGAALLQIAFTEMIFLIDIVALNKSNALDMKTAYQKVVETYFFNEKVLKLGYDIKNDLKMLASSAPEWNNLEGKVQNVLDLHPVKAEIFKLNRGFFITLPGEETGLSELLYLCLEKTLNKSEQFSDWERRPLKSSQITYAAADCYCLLDIFEFLKRREKEMPIGLHDIFKKLKSRNSEPSRKRRSPFEIISALLPFKRKAEPSDGATPFKDPRLASEVKFICDSMLQGLGKQLRSCGINTTTIKSDELYLKCIEQAVHDGKFVLTKGKTNFNAFSAQLPLGNAYYLKSDATIDQLEEVFGYYNLIVDEADSFCLCQDCNTNVFIKVKTETIKRIMVTQRSLSQKALFEKAIEHIKERVPEEMISFTGNKTKNWELLPESHLVKKFHSRFGTQLFISDTNVRVCLNKIPIQLIDQIDGFFICQRCGKCYWESEFLQNLLMQNQTEEVAAASAE